MVQVLYKVITILDAFKKHVVMADDLFWSLNLAVTVVVVVSLDVVNIYFGRFFKKFDVILLYDSLVVFAVFQAER